MGTHPNGPLTVIDANTSLAEYIKANPSTVGRVPPGYAADELPFLFKVLSIRTALSIQVCTAVRNALHSMTRVH